jgi:hypothetical protein
MISVVCGFVLAKLKEIRNIGRFLGGDNGTFWIGGWDFLTDY